MSSYPKSIDSWIGLTQICPRDPLDLIAYAKLGNTIGAVKNSSTYINPSSGWLGDGCSIQREPYCVPLGSANKQLEADADQWNFSNWTNSSPPAVDPRIRMLESKEQEYSGIPEDDFFIKHTVPWYER